MGFIKTCMEVFSQSLPLALLTSAALGCSPIYLLLKVNLHFGGGEKGRIA